MPKVFLEESSGEKIDNGTVQIDLLNSNEETLTDSSVTLRSA